MTTLDLPVAMTTHGKNFRRHLRTPDDPRIAGIADMDACSWAERTLANPRAALLFGQWRERYAQENFHGITTDGTCIPGLFTLADEGAPVARVAAAAASVLQLATADERARLCHPLGARERRAWMNPEVYMHRFGLRLDEIAAPLREAILAVLRAALSPAGYEKARALMRINHFLGELVHAPRVMNEFSYNFNLFGIPSATDPWGWSFYGHHLCLNCLMLGGQMVATPLFMGAEPDHVDTGPGACTTVFEDEERVGLELMRMLDPRSRAAAHLYRAKRDPALPPGRVAIADELHLCGAFRDNRVVPYEGAAAAGFGPVQRRRLSDLIAAYLAYLPAGPLAARMAEVERHLDQTHFCWIGGTDDHSPFYYRIQSPVSIIEFDHHAGVFLGNTEPEKFHIHTIIRTPNGNDYGMDVLRRHCEHAQRLGVALQHP